MKKPQLANPDLFDLPQDITPDTEWRGMPDYQQEDAGPYRQITISFADQEAVDRFASVIGQHLTDRTKSIWYPERERNNLADLIWIEDK